MNRYSGVRVGSNILSPISPGWGATDGVRAGVPWRYKDGCLPSDLSQDGDGGVDQVPNPLRWPVCITVIVGMACVCTVLSVVSPASAKSPMGLASRWSGLPSGWVLKHSALVGSTPPCLASAEAPFASCPAATVAGAGEPDGGLAQLTEKVVSDSSENP